MNKPASAAEWASRRASEPVDEMRTMLGRRTISFTSLARTAMNHGEKTPWHHRRFGRRHRAIIPPLIVALPLPDRDGGLLPPSGTFISPIRRFNSSATCGFTVSPEDGAPSLKSRKGFWDRCEFLFTLLVRGVVDPTGRPASALRQLRQRRSGSRIERGCCRSSSPLGILCASIQPK